MNIIAALLIFTVIVVVHEFGHFLLAKKNGVEVTEFSVGMGPRLITFVKTASGPVLKLFCSQKTFDERKDWNGITKYSWKLFPLGGSCAMVGEDMDDDSEGSFNSKGVWARFSIIFAGPFFNFILAFVFSIIILGNDGIDFPKVLQVYAGQPGEAAGVETGDWVKSIDGHKISIAREIDTYLMLHPLTGDEVKVVVERDGEKKTLTINPNYKTFLFGFNYSSETSADAEVLGVSEGGAFEKAGIKKGDLIKSVNGRKVDNTGQLSTIMNEVKNDGKEVVFSIERGGKESEYKVTPTPYEGKTLGFLASGRPLDSEEQKEKVGAATVLKYSVIEVKYWIETTVASLGQLIGGKLSKDDISGPVGIIDAVSGVIDQSVEYGQEYGKKYGTDKGKKEAARLVIINMLYMSVLLSANLGVMNLLPLPALDGGRLVFIIIEAIRGKPIDREKEGFVHIIGFVILMLFMLFVMFNDIIRIIK